MKAVVAAFNQEKSLVGAFSVITNLRMDFFETLLQAVFQLLNIARDWRRELRQSECGAACGVFLTSWLEYLIISVNLVLLIFQARAMVLCLSILLGLVLFRECLQMMVSLKRYIFDLENWLEMATLLITGKGVN